MCLITIIYLAQVNTQTEGGKQAHWHFAKGEFEMRGRQCKYVNVFVYSFHLSPFSSWLFFFFFLFANEKTIPSHVVPALPGWGAFGAICWGQHPKQCHPESIGYICRHLWHHGIEEMVSRRLRSLMCSLWTLSSAVTPWMQGLVGRTLPSPSRHPPSPQTPRRHQQLNSHHAGCPNQSPSESLLASLFSVLNKMSGRRMTGIFHSIRDSGGLPKKWNSIL